MMAAREGAVLWFNNVLPALLPFMIGTNVLLRLGVVDFFGVILEPVMKPLFGVSGRGAFALAMGATSGYPIGAQVCASLREDGKISQTETQRLLSFVNNSGPLFMIGAVGAGMFGNERIGYFILVSSLSGALLTGLLFKFYRWRPEKGTAGKSKLYYQEHNSMSRLRERKPLGTVISESVHKSLESLLMIAGFIILFSVTLKILEIIGFIDMIAGLLHNVGVPGGEALIGAAIYGFFEITNGASRLAALGASRSVIILCAALVSFGGMSIFAQSIAFLSKTDTKPFVFFFSKLLNAGFTALVGFLIYPLWNFEVLYHETAPVFAARPVDRLVFSTVVCVMMLITVLISVFAVNIRHYVKSRWR